MTLRLFDSANRYAGSDGSGIISTGTVSVDATGGRNSTPAFQNNFLRYTLASNITTGGRKAFIGMHYWASGTSLTGIFGMMAAGSIRAGLRFDADSGSGSTLTWFSATSSARATSTLTLPKSEHLFIEVEVLLETTAIGYVKVWVNGVLYIDQASIITHSAAFTDTFQLTMGTGTKVECFYVATDEAGDGITALLGNVKCIYAEPAADTVDSDFAPLSGTDNYAMVTTSDGDTSYNSSLTDGDKDLFSHGIDFTGETIFAVNAHARAMKPDAGVLGVRAVINSNAVEAESATVVPTTSYSSILKQQITDPNTGLAWTPAGLNAATFGYRNAS